MIAKLHKIGERVESGRHRRTPIDKDAGDVYRLVQVTPVAEMAAGFRLALSTDVARPATELAIRRLQELFARRHAAGVEMAIRAVGISGEASETIAAVLTGYTTALTGEL